MTHRSARGDETDLVVALAQAGLIQFGQFIHGNGGVWPVALHLAWLASYPQLLRQVADGLVPVVRQAHADRILTTAGTVALGTAVGLAADLPVVYPLSDGTDQMGWTIEGAYDIGHGALLLSDVLLGAAQAGQIVQLARRVGLEIVQVLAVIDFDRGAREELARFGFEVRTLVTLRNGLSRLERNALISPAMRAVVESWLHGQ